MIFHNRSWSQASAELHRQGSPYAIVTLLSTAGSTPRAGGSKIVICEEHSYDSIGGGQLEFLACQRAREMMLTGLDCQEIKQFSLGAQAQQCCGGAVTLLFECFAGAQIPLTIFGAGHVARALIPIIADLPFRVNWVDSRADIFAGIDNHSSVQQQISLQPQAVIDELQDNSYVLVLTHDHILDFKLIKKLLQQDRWGFLGLIGSENKARRFSARLKAEGINESQLQALHCPVGMPQVKGKLPMEIAVSIAAQLIETYAGDEQCSAGKAMNWKEMKAMLNRETKEFGS